MATVITAAIPELESLLASLGGGGTAGLLGRIGASALGGVAATELLNLIKGNPAAKKHLPRYAIVDLHTDTTIKYLSAPRVYRLLTRPRGLGRHRIRKEIVLVPQNGAAAQVIR